MSSTGFAFAGGVDLDNLRTTIIRRSQTEDDAARRVVAKHTTGDEQQRVLAMLGIGPGKE